MGSRPLRQYHGDPAPVTVAPDIGPIVEPWERHRARFADRLGELTDEQWATISRCDDWTIQDVVAHLVTADGFWVASLLGAAGGSPTSYLTGFDPSSGPEALVEPMRATPPAEVLESFLAGTAAFVDAVHGLDDPAWGGVGESPIGHVATPLVLAHALWDSWLHERDVFLPLGVEVPIEADELAVATWYSLAIGALEGGLIGDPAPVGPGIDEPFEVSIVFDDLPDAPFHLAVGSDVVLRRGDGGAVPAGSARALVEGFTGRVDLTAGCLPAPLEAQLRRASDIL